MIRLHTFLLTTVIIFLYSGTATAQSVVSLKSALQTALEHNPQLVAEKYNINIAAADINTAKLRPNPSFNNQSLQMLHTGTNSEYNPWSSVHNRQVWYQLTKPIQTPGQRSNKILLANLNEKVAELNYAETMRNVFQDVAMKWLDVWTAQKKIYVLRAAKNNIDTLVSINKVKLKNEVITQTDLLRTELLADQYNLQLRLHEQDLLREIANLKLLLGTTDSLVIDTSDNLTTLYNVNFDSIVGPYIDRLLNDYRPIQTRPDLSAAKAGNAAEIANHQLQKSLAVPVPELGVIYNPQNAVPYVGFYGTIDLPFWSRNQGEIIKATYKIQQSESIVNAKEMQIKVEIASAYTSYKALKQNAEQYRNSLLQADKILNNVKYAYQKGGTTIVDYLEAQRSWSETQQQYFDIQEQYKQSFIKLIYATGNILEIFN